MNAVRLVVGTVLVTLLVTGHWLMAVVGLLGYCVGSTIAGIIRHPLVVYLFRGTKGDRQ